VVISPRNATFDFSSRLKAHYTNNQAEYEALLFGLELLDYMGVKHVKVFGDSQLVVQQILEEYQCLYGTSNGYLERCWDTIRSFDEFDIRHISRAKNYRANVLAQNASGYRIKQGRFHNYESPITGVGPSTQVTDRPGWVTRPSIIGSGRPGKGSRPFDGTRDINFVNSAGNADDAIDWRTPLINYLRDPSVRIEKCSTYNFQVYFN
jgi:ribonuclease HI